MNNDQYRKYATRAASATGVRIANTTNSVAIVTDNPDMIFFLESLACSSFAITLLRAFAYPTHQLKRTYSKSHGLLSMPRTGGAIQPAIFSGSITRCISEST